MAAWPPVLGQLLPIDPQVAIDATKQLADQFQQRFIATTVAIFVLQNVVWLWVHLSRMKKSDEVQEARVQDGKEWAQRMATHLDRNTEMAEALVKKATGL